MAALAAGESHPSWWGLASPDATALVGIQWENVRQSPFAGALSAELTGAGSLGLPDLACLQEAKQILISSPALLAIATGSFPELRLQAAREGFKPARYRGVEEWISPEKSTLSMAQLSAQIVLLGSRKTLEEAIDRSVTDTTGTENARRYSPLLARAARFSNADLWVVANQLPDPLASLFVPLDAEARSFEGAVSLGEGLRIDATLGAGSEEAAAETAERLRQSIPGLPGVARTLRVSVSADSVLLSLDVKAEELTASLRQPVPLPKPAPVPVQPPPPVVSPAPPQPEPVKPPERQVIRILGLDDGPREILLPPAIP